MYLYAIYLTIYLFINCIHNYHYIHTYTYYTYYTYYTCCQHPCFSPFFAILTIFIPRHSYLLGTVCFLSVKKSTDITAHSINLNYIIYPRITKREKAGQKVSTITTGQQPTSTSPRYSQFCRIIQARSTCSNLKFMLPRILLFFHSFWSMEISRRRVHASNRPYLRYN